MIQDDLFDNAYWDYVSYLSSDERKALSVLIVGSPGDHLTPEAAIRRVEQRKLPPGLTRCALNAYDRLAEAKILSGKDTVRVSVDGRDLGQQAFRRELIGKAFGICKK